MLFINPMNHVVPTEYLYRQDELGHRECYVQSCDQAKSVLKKKKKLKLGHSEPDFHCTITECYTWLKIVVCNLTTIYTCTNNIS